MGGRKIAVRVDSEIDDYGQYHSGERKILISAKIMENPKEVRETLRHEMMHAALDMAGISYMKAYEEESIIRAFDSLFFPAWEIVEKQLLKTDQ